MPSSDNTADVKQPTKMRQYGSISTIRSDWTDGQDSHLPTLTGSQTTSSTKSLIKHDGKRRPSEPAYLEGLTEEQKEARREAERLALVENPKADPEFCFLPKGINNKITERDLLMDKFWRMFRRRRKRAKPLDRSKAPPTPLLGISGGAKREPAPTRYCPPILPARETRKLDLLDSFCNPLGGDFLAFSEPAEERDRRIKASQLEAELRGATERRLKLAGREHFSDPMIGRAPPFSRSALAEPHLRRISRERRRSKAFPEPKTSRIPEPSPREILPTPGDRAHVWDLAYLTHKKSYSQSDDGCEDAPKTELTLPRREAPKAPNTEIPPVPRRSSRRKDTLFNKDKQQKVIGLGIYNSSERVERVDHYRPGRFEDDKEVQPLSLVKGKITYKSGRSSEFDENVSAHKSPDLSSLQIGMKVEKSDPSKVSFSRCRCWEMKLS